MKSEKVKTRFGIMSIPSSDAVLGPSLRLYGEWAQDEIEGLSRFLKNGDQVIDAGANIGTHTVGLAAAVSPNGRVYSFEPQLEIFDLLQKNCDSSINASNILLYNKPLSAVGGKKFAIPAFDDESIHNFGATKLSISRPENTLSYESSESITIDELNLDYCRLIKLDVEGMELDVLNGAVGLISKCKPLIFFEANTTLDTWGIIEKIAPLGPYLVRVVISNAFSANNFNNNQENIFSDYQEACILLFREEDSLLAKSAFHNSIQISNYYELIIVLVVLCRRPPGHPLADLTVCASEIEESCVKSFDALGASILHELVYQKHTRVQENNALVQGNNSLIQENNVLIQENNALIREKVALGGELMRLNDANAALMNSLQKYRMHPLIRLLRKVRSKYTAFIHTDGH